MKLARKFDGKLELRERKEGLKKEIAGKEEGRGERGKEQVSAG